jgi:TolA-binding protein
LSFVCRKVPAVLALALAAGCASDQPARKEIEALRAEVRALRTENEALARRVEALAAGVEALSARGRAASAAPERSPPSPSASAAPVIPPDLAVVKVAPPAQAPRRRAPPVPTAIPIDDPDPERVAALGRRDGRSLAAEADAELRAAREAGGVDRAHALEDFAARYPRHPSSDNALVEASSAYAEAGREEAACSLARRAADGYPAGDAMSDALERLAWCESRRGATALERHLLERLVSEYPRSAAARRAGSRLAALAGDGAPAPHPAPATPPAPAPRSGP